MSLSQGHNDSLLDDSELLAEIPLDCFTDDHIVSIAPHSGLDVQCWQVIAPHGPILLWTEATVHQGFTG